MWSRGYDPSTNHLISLCNIQLAEDELKWRLLFPLLKGDQPGIEPGIPATASAKRGQRVTKHKLLDTIHMVPNEQAGEWLASGLRVAGEWLASG